MVGVDDLTRSRVLLMVLGSVMCHIYQSKLNNFLFHTLRETFSAYSKLLAEKYRNYLSTVFFEDGFKIGIKHVTSP